MAGTPFDLDVRGERKRRFLREHGHRQQGEDHRRGAGDISHKDSQTKAVRGALLIIVQTPGRLTSKVRNAGAQAAARCYADRDCGRHGVSWQPAGRGLRGGGARRARADAWCSHQGNRGTTQAPACRGSRASDGDPDAPERALGLGARRRGRGHQPRGESIGDERWTPQRKAALRDSRIVPTRSLVAAIAAVKTPPRVFISGSGVGYYGTSADDVKTEDSPAGARFPRADLRGLGGGGACAPHRTRASSCSGPESCSSGPAARSRRCAPFRLFAGGPMGSGRQYMSWIHRIDWIEMVRWIVETPAVSGP